MKQRGKSGNRLPRLCIYSYLVGRVYFTIHFTVRGGVGDAIFSPEIRSLHGTGVRVHYRDSQPQDGPQGAHWTRKGKGRSRKAPSFS